MRLPSRLTSTICGPPLSAPFLAPGCVAFDTMPPIRILPVSFGLNGSDTSYCSRSPVPQQAAYRNLSSIDRSISVTRGGTALNPLSSGGNWSSLAGSAGISITFLTAHWLPSLYQVQIEDDRFSRLTTQLTKPYALVGSWAGLSSKTNWYLSPKS